VNKQVSEVASFKPDIVLIAVGANDVTHLTNVNSVCDLLGQAVTRLRAANPEVRIIVTGSPDMGSVPRFAQPVRWIAGKQTERLNKQIVDMAHKEQVVFAPIAEQTGPLFRAHPELFAADKFHPTNDGYRLWVPVIERALDQALSERLPTS
jgi:lysophospholipase L1-like esterase